MFDKDSEDGKTAKQLLDDAFVSLDNARTELRTGGSPRLVRHRVGGALDDLHEADHLLLDAEARDEWEASHPVIRCNCGEWGFVAPDGYTEGQVDAIYDGHVHRVNEPCFLTNVITINGDPIPTDRVGEGGDL